MLFWYPFGLFQEGGVYIPNLKDWVLTPKEINPDCHPDGVEDASVRFPNRTIGVNLGIFSSVFESLKGCVFSSTFLKSASMVKRLFYGFQSFAKCRF